MGDTGEEELISKATSKTEYKGDKEAPIKPRPVSSHSRDFHEILHKFQNLDGEEIDAGQDDLQIKHKVNDLEEEDHVDDEERRDVDVQIDNGVVEEVKTADLENTLLPKIEVSIPVEYDEIAVVEDVLDDEADEGEQLEKRQPKIHAGTGD